MRVRTNKLFPYPVLSEYSDSYKDNTFLCDTSFEYDSVTAYIKLKFTLNDQTIKVLLKNDKIGLFFVVDCSETKYRELFPIFLDKNDEFTQEIPLERLNGDIEIVSLLISNDEIINYSNNNLSDEYRNETVILPKYAIVGYTDTDVFYVNKKIDANGDIPSIFTICPKVNQNHMSYELAGDTITISLPKNEYDIYSEYKGKSKRLKQMMINFPVLVDVLDELKVDNTYSDRAWYNALNSILSNKGYPEGIASDTFKNKSSLEIAQDLLGNLIQDAFKDFDDLNSQE